jgi:hypothetical protein
MFCSTFLTLKIPIFCFGKACALKFLLPKIEDALKSDTLQGERPSGML